jgi:pimeloyl-ACP methyl ester carboxylesterase
MIEANGVTLCAETFGEPADPPILLIMGIGASMLWWEEGFCRMLADGGRFVIATTIATPGDPSPTSRGARGTRARTWSPTPPGCSTPSDDGRALGIGLRPDKTDPPRRTRGVG